MIGFPQGKEPQLRNEFRSARQYELMTIFAPDVAEEELQGAIDHVSGIVTTAGGTITLINRESPWGRRRLAYPIRHESRDVRDGIYVLYYFDGDAERIVEIERDLKLATNVIRYMVTKQVGEQMLPPAPEPEPEPESDEVSADGETAPSETAPAVAEATEATEPATASTDVDSAAAEPAPASEPAESAADEAPALADDGTPTSAVPNTDVDAAGVNEIVEDTAAEAAAAGEAGDEPGPQG